MKNSLVARFRSVLFVVSAGFLGAGCSTLPEQGEILTESYVDIERFMGDWYVIASIPTFLEKDIYNATETYRLDDDGTIDTTFAFRKGSFEGKQKSYNPRGFIRDTQSNAEWGMRFVWPIKSDYRIVYVDDAYSQTIIGRNKRDFAWIMARTPSIPNDDLVAQVRLLKEQGYDIDKLQVVPQRWDGQQSAYDLSSVVSPDAGASAEVAAL